MIAYFILTFSLTKRAALCRGSHKKTLRRGDSVLFYVLLIHEPTSTLNRWWPHQQALPSLILYSKRRDVMTGLLYINNNIILLQYFDDFFPRTYLVSMFSVDRKENNFCN